MVAVITEHHYADLHAFGGGGLLARIGNALRGGQVDGCEILNLLGGFAADDKLFRYVLRKRRAAKRDCARHRQSQYTKFHFVPPDFRRTSLPGLGGPVNLAWPDEPLA